MRPRLDLTDQRARELQRRAARVTRARDRLEDARTELLDAISEAVDEGASLRAIGDAVGLSHTQVLRQLNRAEEVAAS
jgi:predicted transcriptional regulator